jgi:hypothetical protein
MTELYKQIKETKVKCNNCGIILKPFEGMLSDLCNVCNNKKIESEWEKIRKVQKSGK